MYLWRNVAATWHIKDVYRLTHALFGSYRFSSRKQLLMAAAAQETSDLFIS